MVQATDTDTTATGNVTPIRSLDEEAAIAWLRAQPGGRAKLSDAELGRRWGWKRQRVGRRIKAWSKEGRVTRRGNTVTYVNAHVTDSTGPATQVDLVPPPVPSFVPPRPVEDVLPPLAGGPPIAPIPPGIVTPWERSSRGVRLATLTAAPATRMCSGISSLRSRYFSMRLRCSSSWPQQGDDQ